MTTNTDETCCWYPDRQELHVNLLPVIGIHTTLILTSWNHSSGITWSLLTDGGIEQYDDPFLAPFFQISDFLNVSAAKPFIDQIPAEVMLALKPFRSDNFGMLIAARRHKFLTNLCSAYCTPFWLFFKQAKNDHWSKSEFLDVCNQGESAMLIACHLPNNDIALEVIAKFTADNFGQLQSDLIYRLFELDYQHLNSIRDKIPDHLLQFLLRYPNFQHMKLIQSISKSDYNNLLRTTRAIQHLAVKLKIDSVNVTKQVLESDSISALKTLQAHLREEAAHRALLDYAKVINDEPGACPLFPSPPLATTENLVAITSAAELLAESQLLRHDLVRFCDSIVDGHYYAYSVLAPERSTLLLYLFRAADDEIVPVIKEVLTYSGQSANAATVMQIRKWLKGLS
jgi:hypothetical protein